MQFTVVSSGSQLLSNSFSFRFKSENEFILEIWKVVPLKKKTLVWWKAKLFCLTGPSQLVFQLVLRLCTGNHW